MKNLSIFTAIPSWHRRRCLVKRTPLAKPSRSRSVSKRRERRPSSDTSRFTRLRRDFIRYANGLMAIALPALLGATQLAQTPEPSPLPEPPPTTTPAPPVQKPRITEGSQWRLCGRKQHASLRTSGFTGDTTGTYIRDIQVNLHSNTYSTVTLNWANQNLSKETLPIQLNASPGAGNCELDCRSIAQSQQRSSHCTPLSPPTYLVQGYDCALAKYPGAKFVTWFHAEREIAFHAYTVPPYPASHGCIRLVAKNHGAEWIYDNTLAGITKVNIRWAGSSQQLDVPKSTQLSPRCWSKERLIDRPTKTPNSPSQ